MPGQRGQLQEATQSPEQPEGQWERGAPTEGELPGAGEWPADLACCAPATVSSFGSWLFNCVFFLPSTATDAPTPLACSDHSGAHLTLAAYNPAAGLHQAEQGVGSELLKGGRGQGQVQAGEQERKLIQPDRPSGVAQTQRPLLAGLLWNLRLPRCWEAGKLHLESSFRQASDARASLGCGC